MKRVLFITEYLDPPYDEGIKKTVCQLYEILNSQYDLQVICRDGPQNISNIYRIKTNKLYISYKLKTLIVDFHPDTIIYFPFASATFAGFIRHFIISKYFPSARQIMIALQAKPLNWLQKILVKLFRPEKVLTPSLQLHKRLNKLRISNELMPLYTDLTKFKPIVSILKKVELRGKYNIAPDAYVVSHMGHLNEGRNLQSLIELQKNGCQVVVVGSSSTPVDSIGPLSLKNDLAKSGIIIFDGYIKNIEEIYQLSDLYIFPVLAPNSAIGLPLSILEARACGLPIITTEFGSVKHYLGNDYGSIYYSDPVGFTDTLKLIKMEYKRTYLETNVGKLNEDFMITIIKNIEAPDSIL